MQEHERLILRAGSLMNSQEQRLADVLRCFDVEQLVAWAESLAGGAAFITSHPDIETLRDHLAATQILREVQRRNEVAVMEADAAGE